MEDHGLGAHPDMALIWNGKGPESNPPGAFTPGETGFFGNGAGYQDGWFGWETRLMGNLAR